MARERNYLKLPKNTQRKSRKDTEPRLRGLLGCWRQPAKSKRVRFFSFLFFKFYFIFKLYNIVLILPNIEMNPPQVFFHQASAVAGCNPSPPPL